MRLVGLYLRSRLAGRAILILGLVAPIAWALTWLLVSQTPYGVASGGLTLLLVFGTLAAACVVGASVRSPFGDTELAAARPLLPLRLGHLFGLLLWSALTLCAVLLTFDLDGARPEYPLLVMLRNLAALTGLALLTARGVGARLSWVLPFVSAIAYLTLMASDNDVLASYANRSYHGLHGPAWALSLAVLALGLGLVCLFGARESAAESE